MPLGAEVYWCAREHGVLMTVLFASRFRVNGLGLLKPEPHESPMGETHQPGLLTPVSGAQCNYVHARWISGKATAQPFGFVCTVMLLDAGGCRELLAARRPCYLNNRGVFAPASRPLFYSEKARLDIRYTVLPFSFSNGS